MATIDDSTAAETHTDPSRIQDTEWTLGEVWSRYGSWVVTVVNLTVFFCIWELFARSGMINQLFLPTASGMFEALWTGLTTSAPPGAVVSGSILTS